LLAGDDFLGKLSNEWVSTVDQQQASHFDGTSVMRYHHREKITVRITAMRLEGAFPGAPSSTLAKLT
jgi:hypothetical protein